MKVSSTRRLCMISVSAAIMAVMSQLSIPMPLGVPITLQTLCVPIMAIVLGWKDSVISIIIYIILGAIGIPVFSGFSGGIGVLFGPTGGFILSFPIYAFLNGFIAERYSRSKLSIISGITVGTIVNLIFGMLMFSFITSQGIYNSFIASVLPFIPGAVIKGAIAFFVAPRIRKALYKHD